MAQAKAKAAAKNATGNTKKTYLQNKQGRVFEATPVLIKQYRMGKMGLMKISESEFLKATENNYMTDPVEDDELDAE